MELTENVNLRDVHFLNSLAFAQFESVFSKRRQSGLSIPPKKELRVLYDKMKHYCHSLIKTRGSIKRIYSYSVNTPTGAGGRWWRQCQRFCRPIAA